MRSVARVDSLGAPTFIRFARTVLENIQISRHPPDELNMFLHCTDLITLMRGLLVHAPATHAVCLDYARVGIALVKMHQYCDMLDCSAAVPVLLLLQEHTPQDSAEDSQIRMLLEESL